MKFFKTISFVVSLILFVSCKNETDMAKNEISKFTETIKLSGVPIKNIELASTNANMVVIDSLLIIQTRQEPFIHIYNTKNYKLLAETGSKGRGPNEFIRPELQNFISYKDSTPLINIYDYTRRRITQVNVYNAIYQKGDVFDQKPLPENIKDYLNHFFYYDNNHLIASSENGGRFYIYNRKSKKSLRIPYLPKLDFNIKKPWLYGIYRSATVVNTKENKFASAPIGLGQLDFFNLEGKYIKSSVFESSKEDVKSELSKKEHKKINIKFQIADITAKDDFIYALNFNNRLITVNEDPSNIDNMKIQVFDWNGKAKKEYMLDKRYITSFAVDVKNHTFYGYSPNESKNNIISYKFN